MAAQGSSIIVHPSTWAWYRLLVERYVGQVGMGRHDGVARACATCAQVTAPLARARLVSRPCEIRMCKLQTLCAADAPNGPSEWLCAEREGSRPGDTQGLPVRAPCVQLALELAIWSLSGPFASLRAVKEAETREVWTPLGVLREGGPTFDSLPNELVAKIARRLDGQSLAVLACLR